MNTQNIIAAIIILAALAYVGMQVWRKVQSFSTKKSCGSDCGCGVKTKGA